MLKANLCKKLLPVFIALGRVIGIFSVFVSGCDNKNEKAKYVFLFIGDGMGQAHITVTEKAFAGGEPRQLWMNTLPVRGAVETWAYGNEVTDSAAAATAIACGVKTRNGRLGLDPDGKFVESVAGTAGKQGWKVGIISDAPLNHATPAGFYAHQLNRDRYDEIAGDLAVSGFEYFGGNSLLLQSKREELMRKLQENNYILLASPREMPELDPDKKYIVHADIPYVIDREKNAGLTLADYTALGIKHLYTGAGKSKGFFLMVEGGKIDWAAHANDGGCLVREVKAFDDAVKVALDFWKKHPRSTTLVVTADHETGGLYLAASAPVKFTGLLRQKHSYKVMNAEMDKYREKDSSFAEAVLRAGSNYGLKNISPEEFDKLHESWEIFTGRKKPDRKFPILYASYQPLPFCVQHVFNQRCGLEWTTAGHSGMPVPLLAGGVGSELFAGHYDNTQIALKLKSLINADE